MSEQERVVLAQLLEVAEGVKDASLLLAAGFQLRHGELYASALRVFGTWEATLARLVVAMRDKDKEERVIESVAQGDDEIHPERERSPDADHAVWGVTTTGEVVVVESADLPLTPAPIALQWPAAFGALAGVSFDGALTDTTVFSRQGLYVGIMMDLAPRSSALEEGQSLRAWLELPPEDGLFGVIPTFRLRQRDDRLLHVTAQGKGKASSVSDFPPAMGKNYRVAFLTNEGDMPIAVMLGEEHNGLFCASAMGQGIHMTATELRTMGRKSVGVNVMKLADESDAVVSAFLTEGVGQVAVVTQEGYGKRLSFREFRKQGRGGGGMQVLRLNPHDRVVAVVPCDDHSDILLTTNQGRIWRRPAYVFPEMGRAARGKRIWEVAGDEVILGASALPCAGQVPQSIEGE